MRSKITLLLVLLASLIQVLYKSTLASIFAKPILKALDYQAFSDELTNIILWIGLGLLVFCFLSAKKEGEKPSTPSIYPWAVSFILPLVICVATVLVVNPDGRFPWNERNAYLAIAPRAIKPNLYANLKTTPDVLIFGSSVSFTVPPKYFSDKWGLDAFNMSINGGTPIDFVNAFNYILSISPDKKTPSVLTVEILSMSLKINTATETPLKLIPYMDTNQGFLTLGVIADHLIRKGSLIDSIFTYLFVDTGRWEIRVDFAKDGMGIRSKGNMPANQYSGAVKNDIDVEKDFLTCDNQQLNTFGKDSVERLVQLSHDHHISIVFYRPPINADFYTLSKTQPADYAKCKELFNQYMQTLTSQNPNIFYKDLSDDPKISPLGQEIYTDAHHLMENGNILVLEALNPELEAAIQWARANRP